MHLKKNSSSISICKVFKQVHVEYSLLYKVDTNVNIANQLSMNPSHVKHFLSNTS